MSWYAHISGGIETSLDAYDKAMECFGDWVDAGSGGEIDFERDTKEGRLYVRFSDVYRNLGRCIAEEAWELAREFPEDTSGEFLVSSTDGGIFSAAYRVANGKVYCRELAKDEEQIYPQETDSEGGKSS